MKFTLCLLLVSHLLLFSAEPDVPPVFRTILRKAGDDGVHTYRIPGLATTAAGTLLAVFDIRHDGAGDLPARIDVGLMRSTDDGQTWSAMQTILAYDHSAAGARGNGVGDPCVVVDRQTDTIFVAALWSKGDRSWHGSGPGLTPDETGQLVLANSADDGQTWLQPVSITLQVKDPKWRLLFQGPGCGIQLKDGALVVPAQFKDEHAVPHACFIASRDHGATWKIAPPAIPAAPPTSEAQIAQLDDGSLLLSMRNEAHAGTRAWARWEWKDDVLNGSWSEPWQALPDPTCMASLIQYPNGPLLFSNPNNARKRAALTVRASFDQGKTWNDGRVIEPGAAMYSCLTVLRDGRIGILYESGPECTLVFARFPLEWVAQTSAAGR
jgi:sialidase-1